MKKILILMALYCLSMQAFAQRRKTVFAEIGGNGILYSANFDIRLHKDRNDGLGFRAGIGGGSEEGLALVYNTNGSGMSYGLTYVKVGIVTVPLSVNYIVGKRRSGFEAGLGATLAFANAKAMDLDYFDNAKGFGVIGVLSAGYRFQPIKNGVMFHLKWTPVFNSTEFEASAFGIGLGYSFK